MRFLRNSFLLSFFLFPSFVFSEDGSCWLETDASGAFTIVCEGSGIIYHYETVEIPVYTYPQCTSLKDSFEFSMGTIEIAADKLQSDFGQVSSSLNSVETNVRSVENSLPQNSADFSSVYSSIDTCQEYISYSVADIGILLSDLSSLRSEIDGISCSECPTNSTPGGSGGSGGNVDFSEILEKLNEAQETREKIEEHLDQSKSIVTGISNTVSYVSFLIEQGFGSTTNELAQINRFLSSVTNFSSVALADWYGIFTLDFGNRFLKMVNRKTSHGRDVLLNFTKSPFNSYYNPSGNFFESLFAQGLVTADSLISLNNYFYYFNQSFGSYTNQFSLLTHSATNYFSFFKKQLSELPVLADYDTYVSNYGGPDKYSYYDFLTNHYVQVSVGGTLSGNLQSKTNWFSRIETLLAALVFSDTQKTTNSVDVSSADSLAHSLTDGLSAINSSASQQSDSLSTSSRGLIQLFTSYCQIFDSAALPSSVVLFSLSESDGSNSSDISFGISSNPEFSFMVESFRFITTFAWATVGIFLLWKFIVWASSTVFVASKFVYTMITKTFR